MNKLKLVGCTLHPECKKKDNLTLLELFHPTNEYNENSNLLLINPHVPLSVTNMKTPFLSSLCKD